MKIYNEAISLQSQQPREVFNITTHVKAAMEKCGLRDGIILISSMHSNCAIIVNDNEPAFLKELENWLAQIAPLQLISESQNTSASKAAAHFQSLLLNHQVIVSFTERSLDLGSGQFVQFVELDGLRPRRILLKVIGE
jgi:secondary thiamine-phosphate synthase enzyme